MESCTSFRSVFMSGLVCSIFAVTAADATAQDCEADIDQLVQQSAEQYGDQEVYGRLLRCQLELHRFSDAVQTAQVMELTDVEAGRASVLGTYTEVATADFPLGDHGLADWLAAGADLPPAGTLAATVSVVADGYEQGSADPALTDAVALEWVDPLQRLANRYPAEQPRLEAMVRALGQRSEEPYEALAALCGSAGWSADIESDVVARLEGLWPEDVAQIGVHASCLERMEEPGGLLTGFSQRATAEVIMGAQVPKLRPRVLGLAAALCELRALDFEKAGLPLVQALAAADPGERASFVSALRAETVQEIGNTTDLPETEVRNRRALVGIIGLATWTQQRGFDAAMANIEQAAGPDDALSEALGPLLSAGMAPGTYPVGVEFTKPNWGWSQTQTIRLIDVTVTGEGNLDLRLSATNLHDGENMLIVGTSDSRRPKLKDGRGTPCPPAGPHTGSIAEKRGHFDGSLVVATAVGETQEFHVHFTPADPRARSFTLEFPTQNGWQGEFSLPRFVVADNLVSGQRPTLR